MGSDLSISAKRRSSNMNFSEGEIALYEPV